MKAATSLSQGVADRKQQRISDRRREEFVDLKSTLLQGWRYRSRQLQQDRDDEHRHRRRKAEETLRERANQIEGHGSNDGRRDRRHVRLATLVLFFPQKFVVPARLQMALSGQPRKSFANIIESSGQQNCRQAAKHDRRKHLGE